MGVAKFTDVGHMLSTSMSIMDILNAGAATVLIYYVLCLPDSSIQASSYWPALIHYH